MKTTPASTETLVRRVTPAEVHQNKNEVLLIDVSTPAEFGEIHIDGSILHPLSYFDPYEVGRLAGNKASCVLICRSGKRAGQAAEKLKASGVNDLCILEGGIQAWEAVGLPLNRGQKRMSLERQVRIAAGSLVLAGAVLAFTINPAWIALSGFVGAGLVFAGVSDTCGMGMLLARMPWNTRSHPSAHSCCLPSK